MRHNQRAYPYYKLARWDSVSQTWKDGRETYASVDQAIHAAALRSVSEHAPTKFRIGEVTADGRRDLEPFHAG